METLAEKLGLYDVVGVFFPGIIAIASLELFLETELYKYTAHFENSFVFISFIIIIAYVYGLVLQECSSFIDRKFLKIREKPKQRYLLKGSKIFDSNEERNIYLRLLNDYFETSEKKLNDKNEKERALAFYYYCASVLEMKNVDGKLNRISSVYGLSRSLGLFYLTLGIYMCIMQQWGGIVCLIFAAIFIKRTYRFAECKVRVVIRQYYALQKEGKE